VTIINTSKRRAQTLAGIMLLTASAGVTGLLGAAAPANAANDGFVAAAVGLLNDAPPVNTVGGLGIAADQNQAYQAALTDCVNKGGHQCVVEAVKQGGCAAAASNDFGEMVGGTDITLRRAGDNARAKLQNKQGVRVVAAGCSNGATLPPAPPPSAPPAPNLRDGRHQPWLRAIGQLHVQPPDHSGHPAIPGPERDHHLRQQHQNPSHDAFLSNVIASGRPASPHTPGRSHAREQ